MVQLRVLERHGAVFIVLAVLGINWVLAETPSDVTFKSKEAVPE